MKLNKFERDLCRATNFIYSKKYKVDDLMEWSSSKEVVESNKRENESVYEVLGVWVAFRDKAQQGDEEILILENARLKVELEMLRGAIREAGKLAGVLEAGK